MKSSLSAYTVDPQEDGLLLGLLATGFALDDRFAAAVKRLTSSDVAFRYGQTDRQQLVLGIQQQDLERP